MLLRLANTCIEVEFFLYSDVIFRSMINIKRQSIKALLYNANKILGSRVQCANQKLANKLGIVEMAAF